jgi:hypothetical protein
MIGAWSVPIAAAAFLLAGLAGEDRAIAVPPGFDARIDPHIDPGFDPGPDGRLSRWALPVDDAARRFGLPARWILAVMQIESGGQTMRQGRPIRSVAGAMGLMQLMPGTWAAMRLRHGLGDDPDAPIDNILAGTAYLAQMHARFGYPGLFAAYHAGPGRYAQYLGGRALPLETRLYVARIRVLLESGRPVLGNVIMMAGAAQDRRPEPSGLFVLGGPLSAARADEGPAVRAPAMATDRDDADAYAFLPGIDRARDRLFAIQTRP